MEPFVDHLKTTLFCAIKEGKFGAKCFGKLSQIFKYNNLFNPNVKGHGRGEVWGGEEVRGRDAEGQERIITQMSEIEDRPFTSSSNI
jgi:hypothetical protein